LAVVRAATAATQYLAQLLQPVVVAVLLRIFQLETVVVLVAAVH
jgi:hypothetical protein